LEARGADGQVAAAGARSAATNEPVASRNALRLSSPFRYLHFLSYVGASCQLNLVNVMQTLLAKATTARQGAPATAIEEARPVKRIGFLLSGISLVLASGVARADGGDPVAARAQLRQGYALKQQGKCKEAVPFLQESARLDRQPKTLLNLGDCEQSLGQLAAAQAHFVEARDLARHQGNDALKTVGEKRLQDVEKRMPKLAIELGKDAPPNTVVTRDGVEVGSVSLRTPLPIDVGRHVVVARGGGFERQFEVTLAEGETKNLEITPIGGKALPKPVSAVAVKAPNAQDNAPKQDPPVASGVALKLDGTNGDQAESGAGAQRTVGLITLGVGVVGLGVGGYFGARALSKKSDMSTMCTDAAPCPPGSEQVSEFENTKADAFSSRTYRATSH